jgi:hypothetical protein
MGGGLLLIWTKMQKLQNTVQTQSRQLTPSVGQANVILPLEAPVLGLLSHGSNHGSNSLALGLAEAWTGKGVKTLVVETEPLRPIASRLNLKDLNENKKTRTDSSLELIYLNPAQDDFGSQLAQAAQGVEQILLSLPSFSHPGFSKAFDKVNHYLLALELGMDSIQTLKGAFALLQPQINPTKQQFLGIQIVSYQAENRNQQNLFEQINQTHKELLLVSPCLAEANQELISEQAIELDKIIQMRKIFAAENNQLVSL